MGWRSTMTPAIMGLTPRIMRSWLPHTLRCSTSPTPLSPPSSPSSPPSPPPPPPPPPTPRFRMRESNAAYVSLHSTPVFPSSSTTFLYSLFSHPTLSATPPTHLCTMYPCTTGSDANTDSTVDAGTAWRYRVDVRS